MKKFKAMTEIECDERIKFVFERITEICYDQESLELHSEVDSIKRKLNRKENPGFDDYKNAINEIEIFIQAMYDEFDSNDRKKFEEILLELDEDC